MSYSDYEHCPGCDGKTIYMGDRGECPEGVVTWHETCLAKRMVEVQEQFAAAAREELAKPLADLGAQITAEATSAERKHICQLMSEEAERLTKLGYPQHGSALRNFAALIGGAS